MFRSDFKFKNIDILPGAQSKPSSRNIHDQRKPFVTLLVTQYGIIQEMLPEILGLSLIVLAGRSGIIQLCS